MSFTMTASERGTNITHKKTEVFEDSNILLMATSGRRSDRSRREYRKNKSAFHASPPTGVSSHLAHAPPGSSPQLHPPTAGEFDRPPGRSPAAHSARRAESQAQAAAKQEVVQLAGVHPHHRLVCDALGLDSPWYAVLSVQKNSRDIQTP